MHAHARMLRLVRALRSVIIAMLLVNAGRAVRSMPSAPLLLVLAALTAAADSPCSMKMQRVTNALSIAHWGGRPGLPGCHFEAMCSFLVGFR